MDSVDSEKAFVVGMEESEAAAVLLLMVQEAYRGDFVAPTFVEARACNSSSSLVLQREHPALAPRTFETSLLETSLHEGKRKTGSRQRLSKMSQGEEELRTSMIHVLFRA